MLRQNSAGNQWLSAGRKTAFRGQISASSSRQGAGRRRCSKSYVKQIRATTSERNRKARLRVAEGELRSPPSTTKIRKKTMVNAVSSQAATLNPSPIQLSTGTTSPNSPHPTRRRTTATVARPRRCRCRRTR